MSITTEDSRRSAATASEQETDLCHGLPAVDRAQTTGPGSGLLTDPARRSCDLRRVYGHFLAAVD